jgi:sugar phosphate isomerase/epimerase
MNQISLHCSSFVASQCGYSPENTWEACVRAQNEYYAPPGTFTARFEDLILRVGHLGYTAMDIWQPGQLDWHWAGQDHISTVRGLLDLHKVTVTSYAGEFGETREEFLAACRVASGIGAPILSGLTELYFTDRAFVVETLGNFNLKLALENHPEETAQQMLDEIGDGGDGSIGTAIDTGWYATRGYDVVRAVQELKGHILHVHLKDVLPGPEHINCGYGRGCVPLEASVLELKRQGYAGDYSVENHNLDHDPDEELKEARLLVQSWLDKAD